MANTRKSGKKPAQVVEIIPPDEAVRRVAALGVHPWPNMIVFPINGEDAVRVLPTGETIFATIKIFMEMGRESTCQTSVPARTHFSV